VGNHELAALGSIPVDDFNQYAKAAALWTASELTAESRDYVESLSQTAVEGDFTLVHGSPRDPVWEYLHSDGVAAVNVPYLETRHCINGHTHVPIVLPTTGADAETIKPEHGQVVELSGQRAFINPGSVGQPRDRDPRASYAVLDDAMNTVTFFRIEYPISETQLLMQQEGLPEKLWRRLELGY
jgi:diadenosine tetraphosphatase ApaH/serine/threonine PP2A family protein phosphatase